MKQIDKDFISILKGAKTNKNNEISYLYRIAVKDESPSRRMLARMVIAMDGRARICDAEWEEEKHPRDKDGKFKKGASSGKSSGT